MSDLISEIKNMISSRLYGSLRGSTPTFHGFGISYLFLYSCGFLCLCSGTVGWITETNPGPMGANSLFYFEVVSLWTPIVARKHNFFLPPTCCDQFNGTTPDATPELRIYESTFLFIWSDQSIKALLLSRELHSLFFYSFLDPHV
jgi:hypothetical protein